MILRACSHCQQKIPSRIDVCPYCRKDFVGKVHPTIETITDNAKLLEESQSALEDLKSDDATVRDSAVMDLSRKGQSVVPHVLRMLSQPNGRHQASVMKLLGLLQDPQTIAVLKQHLRSSAEELRCSAIEALGRFREAEAMGLLLAEMEKSEPTSQAYLASLLSRFESPSTIKALGRLARHRNPEIAFHAAVSLGFTGDAAAGSPLRRALKHRHSVVRVAAKQSLERLGLASRSWSWYGWIVAVLLAATAILIHIYS